MSICCLLPEVINSVGLVFDIVGVLLLFLFPVLPLEELTPSGGQIIIWPSENATERAEKWKRYKKRAIWGISLIVLGFGFQILSNLLSLVISNFR